MCWNWLSAANLSTAIVMAPSPFTDPDINESPTCLFTGFDSPVNEASSNNDCPDSTVPSTGTTSPGLTTKTSFTFTFSTGSSTS